ncbi:MAG: hypothetical protein LIP08_15355 [Bacteroides sp.]|nr:hypothetical protein [Bacteroides sp.]
MYSCNARIPHTFDVSDGAKVSYDIWIGDTQIYSGEILPFGADATLTIDISKQCRTYMQAYYERLSLDGIAVRNVPIDGLFSTVQTFRVSSLSNQGANAPDVSYVVCYDYNTDYISELRNRRGLNHPLFLKADPRQRLFVSGVNYGAEKQQYGYRINEEDLQLFTIEHSDVYHLFSVNLGVLNVSAGDSVTLIMGDANNPVQTHTYLITEPCSNRYVLYYVNKAGGFDSLLCQGRTTVSWSPERTDVNLYNDISNRQDWEQKRLHQQVEKRYELNTNLLPADSLPGIDELIYSPRVFIHDLHIDTITSCLITNTSYTVKEHPYDLPQYTIGVKESQKHIRN